MHSDILRLGSQGRMGSVVALQGGRDGGLFRTPQEDSQRDLKNEYFVRF